ncbi:cysteine-rich CWC family protein [Allohahella marinimesophila]|uniref:Cysteine-rich CWC n=1 Tax=Allohahella marinimesophila TaxID=1054972 RepID=A0ABP7PV51_9GAMM
MHNCPECSKASRCEIEEGRSVCWCFSEPTLPRDLSRDNVVERPLCLCKACLHKVIEASRVVEEAAVKERSY